MDQTTIARIAIAAAPLVEFVCDFIAEAVKLFNSVVNNVLVNLIAEACALLARFLAECHAILAPTPTVAAG